MFDRDVFIFSDKHCAFPSTGDLQRDWARWFRRAVDDSMRQALGAHRWLRTHPDRVFLDPQCQQPFPIALPDRDVARVHVIVVAHGVARACTAALGGSGSLMIHSDLKGIPAHTAPFTIGDLNPDGPFVHALDDTSLDVLLTNLDTVADFAAYLRKKEELLRGGRGVFAAGEEELLAAYLRGLNSLGEHDFVLPVEATHVMVEEGLWEEFQRNPQRVTQIAANEVSYMWDALIEQFNRHAIRGTQYYAAPTGLDSTERIVRFMAGEPRTRRRMLGKALAEMLHTTGRSMRRIRVVAPSRPGDPYYALVLFPPFPQRPYDEYRAVRREHLMAVCLVTKRMHPDAVDIVGISTESGVDTEPRSEDALYFDARVWTVEMAAEAEMLQRDLQILVAPTEIRRVEKEYPDP